jgi:hypothetical protein
MVATAHHPPEPLGPASDPRGADVLDLVADVDDVDPEEMRLARQTWEKYGDDYARRLTDLEAGRHPYQQQR